jgi:hypothetical protein
MDSITDGMEWMVGWVDGGTGPWIVRQRNWIDILID